MTAQPPSRLRGLLPASLDADQRSLYDGITTGPRNTGPRSFPLTDDSGALRGPFNAMLLSPPVGEAEQMLGAAIRYQTLLTARQRELAILCVAVFRRSGFEWRAHVAVGRGIGLSDEELAALRAGEPVGADEQERATVAYARNLVATWDTNNELYDTAVSLLGERHVFELTALVGYYSTLALQLQVYAAADNGWD
jgi:4-carboxymuconolactone decarboxylase